MKLHLGIISLKQEKRDLIIKLRMRRSIFISVVLVIVLALTAWAIYDRSKPEEKNIVNPNSIEGGGVVKTDNWEDLPADIRVPEKGENVGNGIASPDVVGPAGGATDSKFRAFSINISGDKFEPANIAVRKGDTVDIAFKSEDKAYQFVQPDYGFKMDLPVGVTHVQFQANGVGKFRYYCEKCGGPDKGPVGYILVTDK